VHYFAVAIVPPGDYEAQVRALMAPYDEQAEPEHEGAFWDYWLIGGRWTGVFTDYEASKDERNLGPCRICGGTGERMDRPGVAHRIENPEYKCNGCAGSGRQVSWTLVPHYGDVQPVAAIRDHERIPATVITPSGPKHRETWTGSDFIEDADWEKTYRAALDEFPDHVAVVIDYHC
jgi:hypothetical protein